MDIDEIKHTAARAPAIGVATIGEFIRDQRTQAQVSLRQLSKLAGVSNPYLSQVERGLRKPSADILAQIAKGLRISAEQLYIRAGILERRESSETELVGAILADPQLTERQKNVLVEIYDSFRRENRAEWANIETTLADQPTVSPVDASLVDASLVDASSADASSADASSVDASSVDKEK